MPQRSVLENVFLGNEASHFGVVVAHPMRERYDELCARAGFDLPADDPVGTLRIADQQKVEILRALARDAKLVVMDEPTAALTSDESARLLEIVRGLRAAGTTIVYVSHFLPEVLSIADTVTVLRDGRLIHTKPAASETPASVVTAMLGRPMEMTFPDKVYPPADARDDPLGARAHAAARVRGHLVRHPGRRDRRPRRPDRLGPDRGRPGDLRRRPLRQRRGHPRREGAQDPFPTESDSRRDRNAPRVAQGPGPAHAQPDHPERQPRPPRRGLAERCHPAAPGAAPRGGADEARRRAGFTSRAPGSRRSRAGTSRRSSSRNGSSNRLARSLPTSRPAASTSGPSARSTSSSRRSRPRGWPCCSSRPSSKRCSASPTGSS